MLIKGAHYCFLYKEHISVSDEKTARRKPFLNTDNELQSGFKASFLAEEPSAFKFNSIKEATDNLIDEIAFFVKVFKEDENRKVVHPFFGELDFEYWQKFQVKHFTHHFQYTPTETSNAALFLFGSVVQYRYRSNPA